MRGKQRASKVLDNFSQRKVSKNQVFSGLLGIITNGAATVKVVGRKNFVWVRLRNVSNEVIQAFNDGVSNVYDLPVLVEYDPHNPVRYRIIDRDVGRYQNWGGSSTQLPPHGWSHSFPPTNTGGGDVTWIYSKQFMPFLIAPSGTAGAMGVTLHGYTYYNNNTFHYAGDTGTSDLSIYKPTDNQARMILLYLDTATGNIGVATGTSSDFAATITGSAAVIPYIPDLPDTNDIPLAGVRLLSGTSSIQWTNLYDVRPFFDPPGGGGSGAPTNAQYVTLALNGTLTQERVLTAGSDISITDGGANGNVTVGVSTGTFSRANHNHPGGSSDNTVLIYDDHVFKVTGTAIDFIDNLSVVVTGSVAFVAGQAGGGGGSNVLPIFDNSIFKATGSAISFDSNLDVSVTGSMVFVNSNIGAGGGVNELPIFDDSVFKATGTSISFDSNLSVVVTGTSVFVSAPTVAARYTSNTGQNVVNAAAVAIINFEDIDFDTHSAVTTGASWKFTCPTGQGGYYLVTTLVAFASSTGWAIPERGFLQLFKNNSLVQHLDRKDNFAGGGSGLVMYMQGTAIVSLAVGDYIDVRVAQNSGADLALSTDPNSVWVAIARV